MLGITDGLRRQFEALAKRARRQHEFGKAKSLYTCLIAMIKKMHGPESDQLALSFFRLAEIYSDEGNYAGAEVYYSRAIEIWSKTHAHTAVNGLWRMQALTNIQELGDRDDKVAEEREVAQDDRDNVA